ncbi:uncharacterized protein LOC123554666 [Mercenaria mercenaria]|uniref:uncharacterized protein LOC123554666 n=1 Tax=Mercenaria mercenaria TaxID=6596 RepID=UPI001E1D2D0F|nr:uncharacterized protein LOC123554666 [Mercenaria mercenaria]
MPKSRTNTAKSTGTSRRRVADGNTDPPQPATLSGRRTGYGRKRSQTVSNSGNQLPSNLMANDQHPGTQILPQGIQLPQPPLNQANQVQPPFQTENGPQPQGNQLPPQLPLDNNLQDIHQRASSSADTIQQQQQSATDSQPNFTVWIVGSSLIKGAYLTACQRINGEQLGLQSISGNVLWEFLGGMKVSDLSDTITYLLNFNRPPKFLIIHCGGNDIGQRPMVEITWAIKDFITKTVLVKMPETKIIWSQILPRRSWRYISDNVIANKIRSRINSCISTFFIKQGGFYIKYPDIDESQRFFAQDDTHLSNLGYSLMLNNITGAIRTFNSVVV